MDEIYFLAMFNEDTWNEFLAKGSSVYGTSQKRKKRMEILDPGDFLICYITKISRFVGLLEVTSESYIDYTRIWESDIYPFRVNVHPIYTLETEKGIPVIDIKEELTIFSNLKNQKLWGVVLRNSLKVIPKHDAKIIIEKLKEASTK